MTIHALKIQNHVYIIKSRKLVKYIQINNRYKID
jgi:hypothetical protein